MYFNENNSKTNLDNEFSDNKKQFNLKYLFVGLGIVIIVILGIIIYKNILKTETFLVLHGDSDMIIKQHSIYEDAGFKAYDNHGNDLSDQVVVTGKVNTQIVGEYTLTYTLDNISRERTVSVVAIENQVTYLILTGSAAMFLKVGETYQEPGYTVIDNLEDNLTEKVTVSGNVDTTVAGTYKLKYSVTNKNGVTINEERTIIVMDSDISINYTPTKITNDNVTINIEVSDNYFDYIQLPSGEKVTTRMTTYQATKNDTYKFIIYSKNGSYKEQSVEINNIDKQAPTGSCSGYYKNGVSYISVNAKDNGDIAKYQINNETFTSNQITYNKELTTAKVSVYDKANNITNISCTLKDENPVILPSSSSKSSSKSSATQSAKPSSGSNYPQSPTASQDLKLYYFTASNGDKMSYWLYVPTNYSSSMPMIIFLHGSGEAGNDYVNKTTNAITWGPGSDIMKRNATFKAIILMPQTKGKWTTTVLKNVIEISNQVTSQYRVDKQRISLAGFSLGCIAVPDLLGMYPNYFSAVVPIECQRPTDMTTAKKYVNTPTWTFASQDYTNTALRTLTNNIKSAGGSAQHSYYANMGHTGLVGYKGYSIFTDSSINLVSWMTSQRKK